METIELSPNDKKDLLELLDYAKEKKLEEDLKLSNKQIKYGKYWSLRINQLKMVIKGYSVRSGVQSSFLTIDREPNQREKDKIKYKKSLENDLVDFIDYIDEKKGEDSLF